MQLKDTVAIVTGASRGIGLAIARELASHGSSIAMVDVLAEESRIAAESIRRDFNVNVRVWSTDVTRFDLVGNMIDEIAQELGPVSSLVNNAGVTRDGLILRMTEEQWDSVLSVNLKGAFNCTRHVASHMLRARRGSIVNIASVSGQMGNAGQANYAASKAGLVGFTKTIARELAGKGIRCNAIAPGYIRTEMTENLPERARGELKKLIPMRRLGEPHDIARAVTFLLSDDSAYITGQVLSINGGMYM